jgi:predicted DNA-binding ribbon-helix-helix protein
MPHKTRLSATTRSIVVEGAMMTLSLEDPFWRELEEVARENDLTVAELVELVKERLGSRSNLSSALRTYLAVSRVRH